MSKKVGKFDIIGLIARGGFSDVYLAREPSLDVQVAIKIFAAEQSTADGNSAWRQRFLQESKILHSLSSAPNIVRFMEFGFTEENKPYIVMPYYKRTLADLLGEDNKLSQNRCIQIAKQVLSALQAIHRAGILHLDIKPSNLLIDDHEQIQLADFGISELLYQVGGQQLNDVSEHSERLGSRQFASPEQIEETSTLTTASDMYSLAAVLFRCYTGTHANALNMHYREETQDSFVSLLSKILQKEANERPQSAADFLALVNAFEHSCELKQKLSHAEERANQGREIDDNATQVLSASPQGVSGENNKFVQIKDDIAEVLRTHGKVDGFDFERLSLLAKSALHDDFDNFNLQEYIKVLKQQLIRNEPPFARFVLWLEQVDEQIKQGMTKDKPALCKEARENLLQLGIAVLPNKSDAMTDNVDSSWQQFDRSTLDSLIEGRLNDFVAKEDKNKPRQESLAQKRQKKNGPSYFPKSTFTRISLTLFLIFIAALVPNISEFGDQTLPTPQNKDASEATVPKSAIPASKTDTNKTALVSSAQVDSERVFTIQYEIQPKDAEVSFQDQYGEMVSTERLKAGTYTVRISKTGYSTEKQNLQLDDSVAKDKAVIIRANLALSNSRYFIGETDRSVADGTPLEFILLPKTDASSEQIRIMSFEVTNELYQRCIDDEACIASTLLSNDPRQVIFERADHPVVNVSWYDIHNKFIPWLSKQINRTLRLPTEQEWMFAASAGKTGTKYSWGEQFRFDQAHCRDCYSVDWRAEDYRFSTRPVMSFSANQWQLFDLHGNVQEWTSDCVAAASTSLQQRCDQAIVKGGSWFTNHIDLSIQAKQALQKNARSHTTGFRLVEVLEPTMQTGLKDEE